MPEVAALPGASPSPMVTPPSGPSPIAPPAQPGLVAAARAKMQTGAQAFIEALAILKDVSTDEGKAIVDVLRIIGKVIPDVAEGLPQTAMQGMSAGMPAAGAAPRLPGMPPSPRPATMGSGPRLMPSMQR